MQKLNDNIYYIGTNDRTTALFEGMWPLPAGVSYNSYLIDDEKTAVIDCIGQEFFGEYVENIQSVLGNRPLDYIIVNHMEPDHSGALALLRTYYPGAKIVGNKKTMSMIGGYYGAEREDDVVVSDGTTLELGKHTLVFSLIPMVHWPETMVTYEKTTGTLFSGDAFGCFGALNGSVLDTEADMSPYFPEMRRYYSNIVGKYATPVQNAIKKLASTDIKMICSTHGPVWIENISRVVSEYDRLSRYEARCGAVVVYASMYGNTRKMAEQTACGLASAGIREIRVYDAARTPLSFILSEIFEYRGLVLGAATYNGSVHPAMKALMDAVEMREVKHRVAAVFGSFTWAAKAVKTISEFVERVGFEQPAPAVEMKQGFDKTAADSCFALGKAVAAALKA